MIEVVEVILKNNGHRDLFKVNKENLIINQTVVVDTLNDFEIGKIVSLKKNIKKEKAKELGSIVRVATTRDLNNYKKNYIDSQKAFIKCRSIIKKNNLNMNLVSANYTFDRSQLIFKFTSEDRIDFRNLAKDLASIYRTRIELRQVGVRDKAKEIGGCGQCGRELCCKSFLSTFNSVSINMAKNQNIALNPSKINGICGRLLCCLQYEDSNYREYRKNLPCVWNNVEVDGCNGKVINVDILNQKYWVDVRDKGIVECVLNDSTK